MPDGARPASLVHRVTVLEVQLSHLARSMDSHLAESVQARKDTRALIERLDARAEAALEKLDQRADAVDRRFAYGAGAIAIAMFLGQTFGPALARAIGLLT